MSYDKVKSIVWLCFFICFPSFHFYKTLRPFGLVLYLLVTFLILILMFKHFALIQKKIDKYSPKLLFLLFFVILFILFSFWYPYESTRSIGTDRDEALNQAVNELVHFKYPYYARTIVEDKAHQMGLDNNPITILPGSIFFAIPFVFLLGNSAYQNFFWITILFLFIAKRFKSYSFGLLFIVMNLGLCATFLFQTLIGSDYVSNSIWIFMFTVLFIENSWTRNRNWILHSILLGIGFSSRLHFLLIIIPIAFCLFQTIGFWKGVFRLFIVASSFLIITLPFLIYDYPNFTPLWNSNLYSAYTTIIPSASIVFPLIVLIVTCFLSALVKSSNENIYQKISVTLFIPVLILVALYSFKIGRLSFNLSHYALPSMLFMSYIIFRNREFEKNNNVQDYLQHN